MVNFFLITIFTFILFLPVAHAQETPLPEKPDVKQEYYQARVKEVRPRGDVAEQLQQSTTVEVEMVIESRERLGHKVTTLWSNDPNTSRTFQVEKDMKLLIMCTTINGQEGCEIISQQRMAPLILLVVFFVAVVAYVAKRQGVRSLIAMLFGLAVISFVIIPLILKGMSPLLVT